MLKLKFIFLIGLCFVSVNCVEDDDKFVTVKNGVLKGEKRGKYFAFEGIPYAEPPIEENRFEPPKPFTINWNEVRNATTVGESCMQWDHFIFTDDKLRGSEDCLFLNVYTPNPKSEKKYPVIIYFHGGAFMFGNGDYYGPSILLQRPLIYVNLNYRLGPLGFLSTEDGVVPGNMGLKDQSLAIKWVKDNIESFGGDPTKITLTGYSAGGASVHLHYLSKLSHDLFQNGISHSGCALNPWVFQEHAIEKAKIVAKHLDCPTAHSMELVECLKKQPAEKIVRTVKLFQPWLYNPFSPFGPVVESIESDTAFITEHPSKIIDDGKAQNLPWLSSAVEAEGIYPAGEIMQDEKYLVELDQKWNEIAPHLLDYNWTIPEDERDEFSNNIRKYYLQDLPINESTFTKVIKIISDRLYLVGLQRSFLSQAKHNHGPVYFYYFKFSSAYGLEHALSQRDDIELGVSHGDDTLLIYDTELRRTHPYNEEEISMQNKFLDLYFNFAKYGRLVFDDTEFEPITPNDEDTFKYLEIIGPDNFVIKTTNDLANKDFWKDYSYN